MKKLIRKHLRWENFFEWPLQHRTIIYWQVLIAAIMAICGIITFWS